MVIVQIAPTRPDLALTDGAIRALFPSSTLEAGRIYELRGRVLDLAVAEGGASITAQTIGTQPEPYTQRITVGRSRNGALMIGGRCTCPVGFQCKHVAAVLIAAHRQQVGSQPNAAALTPQAPPPAPRPRADAPLPFEISGWLAALETAEDSGSEDYPPTIRNRVLYVLDVEKGPPGVPNLSIQPVVAMLRKDDSITTAKPYALHQVRTPARYLRPSDKLILTRLDRRKSYQSAADEDPVDTLRRILATGRATWGNPYGERLSEGPPRPGQIVWQVSPDGSQHPLLEVEGGPTGLRIPAAWYVDPAQAVIGPVTLDLVRPVAEKLLSAPPIPAEMVPKVRAELAKRMPDRPLPAPRELDAPEPITQRMRPRLRLMNGTLPADPTRGAGAVRAVGGGLWAVPVVRLAFDYGPVTVPCTQRPQPRIFARDGVLYEPARDILAEQEAQDILASVGFGRVSRLVPVYYQHAHTDDFVLMEGQADVHWMTVITRDVPMLRRDGWTVEIDPDFPFQVVTADAPIDAVLEEEPGRIDWLELHLGVTIDGERLDLVPALIRLIASMKGSLPPEGGPEDTFSVPLPDGRILVLPLARIRPTLAALTELFATGVVHGDADHIGFSKLDAADLAAMEARAGLIWRGGEALRDLGRQLREAGGAMPHAALPASFRGALRPYQAQGVDWLQFLRAAGLGGVLADDMGLGKTVQTLAHLAIEQAEGRLTRPALIVCPTSLIPNWTMEAEKFAPSLRVLPLHGPSRKGFFDAIPDHDLVLTTYPLLTRDQEILTEQDWHAVILDEAQTIKNPNAETTRQALRLKAGQRLCLSGTPLQNHLGELWSLFDFLAPGFLGGQKAFRTRYRTPIEKHGDVDCQSRLTRRVRPFLLRRTKEEVATELPPKTEITEHIEMEPPQRAIYDGIRLAMHSRVQAAIAEKGLARSGIVILDALLKMRQACCDPRLLKLKAVEKSKAASAKLDRLMEMLTVMLAEGRRVLLFSQFTEMLALIERRLWTEKIEYVLLTGDTKDRRTPVKRFQAGEVPVFLISLKAGGVGLNLTAADTVIHYDPWWNPAVEDQATDRAHRIGQDKKVFVHRLVTVGTIEEKMELLKEKKRGLVASVLEAEHGGALKLTEADVEELFAGG